MPRAPRSGEPDGWFHVMNRALPGRDLFPSASDRRQFLTLLVNAAERTGVELHAYCLMDTHFHLLVRGSAASLSALMRLSAGTYARNLNARVLRDGPVFRGRFASRTLRTPAYVAAVAQYIHENPVEVVGAASLADYLWSSLRVYLGRDLRPAWLHTEVISEIWTFDA